MNLAGRTPLAALLLLLLCRQCACTPYTLIIDSGSSGTRIYAYTWRSRVGQLPLVEAVKPSAAISRIPRKAKAGMYERVETQPGLTHYVRDPQGLAQHGLVPLLDWAKAVVPRVQWKSTPVFLLATAGMRKLPLPDQATLLTDIRAILVGSGFRFDPSWVRVITGAEEGAFGWVAANYLHGSLGQPVPLPLERQSDMAHHVSHVHLAHPSNSNRNRDQLLSTLDLGGSSLEVTTLDHSEPDDATALTGSDLTHTTSSSSSNTSSDTAVGRQTGQSHGHQHQHAGRPAQQAGSQSVVVGSRKYFLTTRTYRRFGLTDTFDRSVAVLLQEQQDKASLLALANQTLTGAVSSQQPRNQTLSDLQTQQQHLTGTHHKADTGAQQQLDGFAHRDGHHTGGNSGVVPADPAGRHDSDTASSSSATKSTASSVQQAADTVHDTALHLRDADTLQQASTTVQHTNQAHHRLRNDDGALHGEEEVVTQEPKVSKVALAVTRMNRRLQRVREQLVQTYRSQQGRPHHTMMQHETAEPGGRGAGSARQLLRVTDSLLMGSAGVGRQDSKPSAATTAEPVDIQHGLAAEGKPAGAAAVGDQAQQLVVAAGDKGLAHHSQLDHEDKKKLMEVAHPCMVAGYVGTYARIHHYSMAPHLSHVRLVGAPDPAACRQLARTLVARTLQPCNPHDPGGHTVRTSTADTGAVHSRDDIHSHSYSHSQGVNGLDTVAAANAAGRRLAQMREQHTTSHETTATTVVASEHLSHAATQAASHRSAASADAGRSSHLSSSSAGISTDGSGSTTTVVQGGSGTSGSTTSTIGVSGGGSTSGSLLGCPSAMSSPPLSGRVLALTGFYVVWRFFLGPEGPRMSDPERLRGAAHAVCAQSWSSLHAQQGHQANVEKYCLWGQYVVELLGPSGLRLSTEQVGIGSGDIGWPLGAMLSEVSKAVPELVTPAAPPPTTRHSWLRWMYKSAVPTAAGSDDGIAAAVESATEDVHAHVYLSFSYIVLPTAVVLGGALLLSWVKSGWRRARPLMSDSRGLVGVGLSVLPVTAPLPLKRQPRNNSIMNLVRLLARE